MPTDVAKLAVPVVSPGLRNSRRGSGSARGGHGGQANDSAAGGATGGADNSNAPRDPLLDLTGQLKRLTLNLKHNTAAFDVQRSDVAALREDVDGQKKALEGLQRRFSNVEKTVSAEFKALGASYTASFDSLYKAINEMSEKENQQHRRLITTIESFMLVK
ncbi:hypothetical protein PENSPDRAFT_693666 [Peniophora sp. CONT]|nr:hypothetical protein PENSPDRAFT_693666 [Peniophora sp. CONT]